MAQIIMWDLFDSPRVSSLNKNRKRESENEWKKCQKLHWIIIILLRPDLKRCARVLGGKTHSFRTACALEHNQAAEWGKSSCLMRVGMVEMPCMTWRTPSGKASRARTRAKKEIECIFFSIWTRIYLLCLAGVRGGRVCSKARRTFSGVVGGEVFCKISY